jgi:hypothetical protein
VQPIRLVTGCWRTLQGLAEFAIVQSCLSAAKWGISKRDALRALFNGIAGCRSLSSPPDNPARHCTKSHR